MEAAFVLIPIALTIVSTIGFACQYTRMNNRIVSLEEALSNMTAYINTPIQQYQVAPPSQYTMAPIPSAPPAAPSGYGYQYYPGNPNIV